MRERIKTLLNSAIAAHTELRCFTDVAIQGLGWASEATRIHQLLADSSALARDTLTARELRKPKSLQGLSVQQVSHICGISPAFSFGHCLKLLSMIL
jgi:hypothetical protein